MRKELFLILCLSCLSIARAADFSADARGTAGAQFLELPVGARAIAMGSAYSSIGGDPFAAYYNPAGLARVDRFNAGLMHAIYFQDISYEYGVFAVPIMKMGVIGVSVQYLAMNDLAEIDKTGTPTGDSFKPNDSALSVLYAKQFGFVDVGVAGKYIQSQIRKSAATFAGDIGVQAKFKGYSFGLSASNVGKGLKFHEEESGLPTTYRAGFSGTLGARWFFTMDGISPKGASPLVAAGVEYKLLSNQRTKIFIRTGYNSRYLSSKLGGVSGVNAGAGLGLGNINIDYAWSIYGDLGSTHLFSIAAKFGSSEKKAKNTVPTTKAYAAAPVAAQAPIALREDSVVPQPETRNEHYALRDAEFPESPSTDSQKAGLTNSRIIALTKAGTSDNTIISLISQFPETAFDTNLTALIEVHDAGVSDAVINAMKRSVGKGK